MRKFVLLFPAATVAALCACINSTLPPNPFLTLTEDVLGVSISNGGGGTGGGGTGGGGSTTTRFRSDQVVTLANNDTQADLNVSFAAWVGVNSLRSAEQQDLLLSNGYVQLTREARIGVLSLPAGTFVFNGPGLAGATRFKIAPGEERSITLITPDQVLLYSAPPVSCEDVAFYFTINDELVRSPDEPSDPDGSLFDGATRDAGIKTLAQIDAYDCDPLAPGLFLKTGGGQKQANEFFEGEAIRCDFQLELADPRDPAGIVTVGTATGA